MTGPLAGRTAIVLGAAGELGVGVAQALADAGARVVVAGDSAELDARFGGDDRFDLRTEAPAGSDALAAEAAVADILVHCASPTGIAASPWPSTPADSACVGELRRLVPPMAARRRGSIIAISSPRPCAGRGDGPSSPPRGPLLEGVRGLASELRPSGVRVNAISVAGADCASAVVFLASDASLHVTGARLAVEPGWSSLEVIDERQLPVTSTPRRGVSAPASLEVDAGLDAQPPLLPFPRRPDATESLHERRRA